MRSHIGSARKEDRSHQHTPGRGRQDHLRCHASGPSRGNGLPDRPGVMANKPISYSVIRGKVIDSDLIQFGGRGGDITFLAPDPLKIVDQIPLASARLMEDLYAISFDAILDYLAELGARLDIKKNDYLL